MTRAKFTPGPWRLNRHGKFFDVSAAEKCPVVKWAGFDDCERKAQVHLANAALIAAAPTMYAALEALKHKLDNYDGESLGTLAGIADEALSLARGERD